MCTCTHALTQPPSDLSPLPSPFTPLPSPSTPLSSPSTPLPSPTLMVAQPSTFLLDNRKGIEQGHSGVECGVDGMEQGPEDDSNSSWVAEDTSDELEEGTGQTRVTGSVQRSPTDAATVEHRVQRLVNPVFGPASRPRGRDASLSTFSARTVSSSSFSPRVLHTRPLSTSTPQLSPINEEELPHPRAGRGQLQGGSHGNRRVAHPPHNSSSSSSSSTLPSHSSQPRPTRGQAVDKLPSIPEQSLFHTTPASVAPPTSQ